MLDSGEKVRENGAQRCAGGPGPYPRFKVESPNVMYEPQCIVSDYEYSKVDVTTDSDGTYVARPEIVRFNFRTSTVLPKLGLMLVGWGGNNGATVTASIIANRRKLRWKTRTGEQGANYLGSVTQASTLKLGNVGNQEVYVPFSSVVPMVHPNDLVIGGWDISSMNLADALDRAATLEPGLTEQVRDEMKSMVPLPSVYYPDFIATNQNDRADNLIKGTKKEQLDVLIDNIKTFKRQNSLDKVIVLWTANTERYSDVIPEINGTADNLLRSIERNEPEVSASTVFAVASILAGATFINGSPQNTFVPGVIELATRHNIFIGGDDFKSGQTKIKSVLVDFLVNAGIKPLSITSYNHLGNNDGMNLSSAKQFRSKEISKSSVVDDMVNANKILYRKGEHPDHTIVIKYVPSVGDSKRALDEYHSEIFMGGRSIISIYNLCEDSLLAAPIIIDLAILAELLTRITYRSENMTEHRSFHPVMSLLSYLLKAPLVTPGTPVINSLQRQRKAIENVLRACVGLPPDNDMNLEYRCL